ncbi:hypothetical protein F4604DRAFT_1921897 [Suillus subluteus]|nr:hypothetical protein F4604DRAFT_1921897 [Suillus subluteus]
MAETTNFDDTAHMDFLFPPHILEDIETCLERAFLSPLNVYVDEFNLNYRQIIAGRFSAHEQRKDPGLTTGIDESAELTSVVGSPSTITKNSPALRPIRTYSDVVRASSPVSDAYVTQESNTPTSPLVGLDTNSNKISAGSNDEQGSPGVTEKQKLTSSDEDDDDHPWIKIFRKGRNRAKTPELLSQEQRETVGKAE